MKNTTAKKFKYGSLSVVFTVVFIALVIGVNLIVSALDTSFNLRVDLTETELYSISPETDVALRAGLGDNYESFKVTIKFLDERDVIESSETALYVQQLAEEYARQYPNNISVEYIDITKNPGAVEKYLNKTQTSVDHNYVIIEGAYHYRILHLAAFFITSEDTGALYAFQGESRFTAAILQSSIETPQIVAFTTQHGETTSASMMSMFDEAGFEIQTIDLAKEEIPEDVRILVISNPTNDFQGFDGANPDVRTEMVKISEYMQSYRSLIVLVNKETPALPNLQEYLWEYWGLNYKPQHLISDEKSSLPGTDYYSVIAEYVGHVGKRAQRIPASPDGFADVGRAHRVPQRHRAGRRYRQVRQERRGGAANLAQREEHLRRRGNDRQLPAAGPLDRDELRRGQLGAVPLCDARRLHRFCERLLPHQRLRQPPHPQQRRAYDVHAAQHPRYRL